MQETIEITIPPCPRCGAEVSLSLAAPDPYAICSRCKGWTRVRLTQATAERLSQASAESKPPDPDLASLRRRIDRLSTQLDNTAGLADRPERRPSTETVAPRGRQIRQTDGSTAVVREAQGASADRSATYEPIVSAQALTKRYGKVLALDGVSFCLYPGTVTAFLGPNGAGKTTALRLLLGLARPTAGEALLFGCRYQDLERPAWRVGAVLESEDFDPGRSAGSHLRALALGAQIPTERVEETLELVGLTDAANRPVRTYSLGMRQRLGLAGALLGDPDLLLLDEPANGLDPAGVHWLRSLLRGLAARGRTVLISSHVLAEVAQTVDEVMVIDRGRLLAANRLDEFSDRQSLEETYLYLTTKERR